MMMMWRVEGRCEGEGFFQGVRAAPACAPMTGPSHTAFPPAKQGPACPTGHLEELQLLKYIEQKQLLTSHFYLHGHAVELVLGVRGHALALALGRVHPVGACAGG